MSSAGALPAPIALQGGDRPPIAPAQTRLIHIEPGPLMKWTEVRMYYKRTARSLSTSLSTAVFQKLLSKKQLSTTSCGSRAPLGKTGENPVGRGFALDEKGEICYDEKERYRLKGMVYSQAVDNFVDEQGISGGNPRGKMPKSPCLARCAAVEMWKMVFCGSR
jgi:hypothetical protein